MDFKPPKENKYGDPKESPHRSKLDEIYKAGLQSNFTMLRDALSSASPFIRNASIAALSDPKFHHQLVRATEHQNPDVRLGVMIALQRSDFKEDEPIARALLSDLDVRIRRQALIWIGTALMTDLRPHLERAVAAGRPTPEIFETYLETVRNLQSGFVESYKGRSEELSRDIPRPLPDNFIESLIQDESNSSQFRALALKYLSEPATQKDLLLSYLEPQKDEQLQFEAIQVLAQIPHQTVGNHLLKVAIDTSYPDNIRAEAVLSLQRQPIDATAEIIHLLDDPSMDIQIEAVRYLRLRLSAEGVRDALKEKYAELGQENNNPIKEQISLGLPSEELNEPKPNRPSSLQEWQNVLKSENGDSERGRRVFFSIQSTCSSCHAVKRRGGDLGPDLSNAGQSKSREQFYGLRLKLAPNGKDGMYN